MESRLSAGVVDPKSGNVYSAAAGSWLLAATSTPSIVLGAMDGNLEPTLRITPLVGRAEGQWGLACDCKMDIGAVVADWRPLFFGSGS